MTTETTATEPTATTTTTEPTKTSATTESQDVKATTTAGVTALSTESPGEEAQTTQQQGEPAKWPETWRSDWSGGDEKVAKMLERFESPAALVKSYNEAAKKIRSGELAKPLPKDATPEQIAEYRAEHGIPEKPEGYFEKMPEGLVIGEEDKELFSDFAGAMHELNLPPAAMHKAVEWYYGMQEAQLAKAQEMEKQQAAQASEALRKEWGQDHKANINLITSHLDSLGELKPMLMDALMPDGTRLFNNPDIVKWFAAQARLANPGGTIVPGGGNPSQLDSVQGEIDKIETVMRTRRTEYNKDENMQARLRQLYDTRAQLQAKGKAA